MKSVRCGAARHAATARRGLGGHGQVAPGAEHPAKKGAVTTKKGTASWEELVACSYMYVMHKSTSLITCHADLQRLAMTPTLAAHTPRRRRRERVMPAMCFCLRVVHVVVHFRRRQARAAPARARDSSLRAWAGQTRPEDGQKKPPPPPPPSPPPPPPPPPPPKNAGARTPSRSPRSNTTAISVMRAGHT